TTFTDGGPTVGSLVYSISAVYEDGEESPFASTTVSFVEFKTPTDLKVERVDMTDNIKVSWNAPVYEQTIYWGTLDPAYMVGYENKTPFYFGQKWSREEISPFEGKFIKAVRFIPLEKNTYEIYISQGGVSCRQPVESSSLKYRSMNVIPLDNPFVIGSGSLIVSVYVSEAGDDYPAICDGGPVIEGKGNLHSSDGEVWDTDFDEDVPEGYNFIVSAVVSTEGGTADGSDGNGGHELLLQHGADVPDSGSGSGSGSGLRTEMAGRLASSPYTGANSGTAVAAQPFYEDAVSLRTSMPAAFPEITKYRIYCNGSVQKEVNAAITELVVRKPTGSEYRFEVSAFYGNTESDRSEVAAIFVGSENVDDVADIYPTMFSGFVSLKGHASVMRVDAVSISGKICLVANHPNEIIDTSSLSPGVYFFRLYDGNNRILKVVRAVKTN
ncbi:MAG: T9SS type A sorting domain-containing protein, partial [Tannerella sp.]|nr:T9SS type A sorting domain-containing protein [Tannerella sp.]